jgi:hypothetical protein
MPVAPDSIVVELAPSLDEGDHGLKVSELRVRVDPTSLTLTGAKTAEICRHDREAGRRERLVVRQAAWGLGQAKPARSLDNGRNRAGTRAVRQLEHAAQLEAVAKK